MKIRVLLPQIQRHGLFRREAYHGHSWREELDGTSQEVVLGYLPQGGEVGAVVLVGLALVLAIPVVVPAIQGQ